MRTGVIAKKVGMTRLFQEDGRHVPVTVPGAGRLPGGFGPHREIATDMSRSSSVRAGQAEERRQAAARAFRQG
jgi:hypothetical protein